MEIILEDIAGWIAPIATMIAAMMTAANLGARVTGWGFVVFTLGSVAWSLVGIATGQTNLLATNAFLTLVNLVGIWRWLGRQRAYEDGARSAEQASRRSTHPTLFTASGIAGMPVCAADGEVLGKAVDAMLSCETGRLSYVVVRAGRVGGVAETLRAVDHEQLRWSCDHIDCVRDRAWFERLPPIKDAWPVAAASGAGSPA